MAGRPRKPTALKLLQGNPGKRKLPEREPAPRRLVGALAEPPGWLVAPGRELWVRLVPLLAGLGIATELDCVALELLCETWGEWRIARAVIEREGLTYEAKTKRGTQRLARPEVRIASAAAASVLRLLTEFGCTPASRSKVAPLAPPDEFDPMEELLSRR